MYTKKNITRKITEYNKKTTENRQKVADVYVSMGKKLLPVDCCIINFIADFARTSKKVFVSQSYIAEKIADHLGKRVCRATINRRIQYISNLNILVKHRRFNSSCYYQIIWPPLGSEFTIKLLLLNPELLSVLTSSVTLLFKKKKCKNNNSNIGSIINRFFDKYFKKSDFLGDVLVGLSKKMSRERAMLGIYPPDIVQKAITIWRNRRKLITIRDHFAYIFQCCKHLAVTAGIQPCWYNYYFQLPIVEFIEKYKQQFFNKTSGLAFSKTGDTCIQKQLPLNRVPLIEEDSEFGALLRKKLQEIKNRELQAKLDISSAFGVE